MYIIGVLIFLACLAGLTALTSSLPAFMDFPSLLVILALSIPILMASGLLSDFFKGFKLMGSKVNPFSVIELKRIQQANKLAVRVFLLSGAIGVIMGLVSILSQLNDMAKIGQSLAVAILTALYALIFVFIVLPVQGKVNTVLATME